MNLRFATAEDAPRLIEMACRFLLTTRYGPMFSVENTPNAIGALIAQVILFGGIIVAELPDDERYASGDTEGGPIVFGPKLVGMLALVIVNHPLTGEKYAEELAWWVEPEYRKTRIGPKMLRAAEEFATRNCANMIKMVAPAGSTVGSFYEKLGYEAVETAYIKSL